MAFGDNGAEVLLPTVVEFDMLIVGDGDSIPDNSATGLSTVQTCFQANPGQTVTADTIVDEIPGGADFAGFTYVITFHSDVFAISASTHNDPAINLIASAPGSEVVIDLIEEVGSISIVTDDFGQPELGPAGGVLGRYTIDVSVDAAPGVYDFALEAVALFDSAGTEIPLTSLPANGQIAVTPLGLPHAGDGHAHAYWSTLSCTHAHTNPQRRSHTDCHCNSHSRSCGGHERTTGCNRRPDCTIPVPAP